MPAVSYIPTLSILAHVGLINKNDTTSWVADGPQIHATGCDLVTDGKLVTAEAFKSYSTMICWKCCTKYLENYQVTPSQQYQAYKIAVLQMALEWLLEQEPTNEYPLVEQLSDALEMWVTNLSNVGSHPQLDALHHQQLTQLTQYKAQHQQWWDQQTPITQYTDSSYVNTLRRIYFSSQLTCEQTIALYPQKTWCLVYAEENIPNHLLTLSQLPDLGKLKAEEAFIVETTFATAIECDADINNIIAIGDGLDPSVMGDVARIAHNTTATYDLVARIKLAKALNASLV